MNEASQPSQQNTIIEEIKHRVLEVDALRNGAKHPEDIELPLDYIAALDEITTIDREEIEDIARDVIAKHKNITRIIPQKRQKNKQRDMNQWLINISLLLIVSVAVKVLFLDDGSPKDPNEKSFATKIASTDFNALQQDASDIFSDVARSAESLIPSSDAIPDLPFTLDDIQKTATSTFSSIVQSTQDLFPDAEMLTNESAEVSAVTTPSQVIEASTSEETASANNKLTEDIAQASTLALNTNTTATAADEVLLTENTQPVDAIENTQPTEIDAATIEAANKAIETAMTKGTTVAEELEKIAFTEVIDNNPDTANIALTDDIENAAKQGNPINSSEMAVQSDEIHTLASEASSDSVAHITHASEINPTETNSIESLSSKPISSKPMTSESELIEITSTQPTNEASALVAEQASLIVDANTDKSQPAEQTTASLEVNIAVEPELQVAALKTVTEVNKALADDTASQDTEEVILALESTATTDTNTDTTKADTTKADTTKSDTVTANNADITETSAIKAQSSTSITKDKPKPTAQQASEIASTPTNSGAPKNAEEYISSSVMPETGLLTAVKQAFYQLANIKTLPSSNTILANNSVNEKTSADKAEAVEAVEAVEITDTEIAASKMPSTEVINNNAVESNEIEIDPVTEVLVVTAKPVETAKVNNEAVVEGIENIQVADVIEVADNRLVENTAAVTITESPNTAVTLPEPLVVEETSIATIGNSQPISTAPIEPLMTEMPASVESSLAINTQKPTSNDKVSIAENNYPLATTIAAKPISTEPEVLATTLVTNAAEKQPMLSADKTTLAVNEIASTLQTQSGPQVLRVALGNNDAIDEVTEKLIAAQQAPLTTNTVNAEIIQAPASVATVQTASSNNISTAKAPSASFNGLNLKLQLNSIVDLSQLAKMSVSQFYTYQARLPKPADKIDLPINDLKAHPLISDIFLSEQSDVIVKLAKYYGEGSQLTFTPSIDNDGKLINWKCNANIDPALLTGPGESPCQLTKSAALPAVNTKL